MSEAGLHARSTLLHERLPRCLSLTYLRSVTLMTSLSL